TAADVVEGELHPGDPSRIRRAAESVVIRAELAFWWHGKSGRPRSGGRANFPACLRLEAVRACSRSSDLERRSRALALFAEGRPRPGRGAGFSGRHGPRAPAGGATCRFPRRMG